jgi:hypothetical protein
MAIKQEDVQLPKPITTAAGKSWAETVCVRCGDNYYFSEDALGPETKTHCNTCATRFKTWCELCPKLYRETDLNHPSLPHEKINEVLAWKYGREGLLLHGETGHGKTRAAWLLLERHFIKEDRGFKAFDAVSFSHAVAREFGTDGRAERWIDRLLTTDLLFLDDLGKCRLTERVQAELFGVIEGRMARCKPMLVTTNFVGETLAENLRDDVGKAMVRRLRECCKMIAF